VFGEQLGQGAEGSAVRRSAATAVKTRIGEGDVAERRRKTIGGIVTSTLDANHSRHIMSLQAPITLELVLIRPFYVQ
jgi:hypothetical protein